MDIGFIGLGKMGKNMTLNLLDKGHHVVATDIDGFARKAVATAGAIDAPNVDVLIEELTSPRVVWVMVPAGNITESILKELSEKLDSGDTVINGGNSFFKNSIRHGELYEAKGIHFMDVGVSGGQEGARNGACLMIGGEKEGFIKNEEIFKSLAAPHAYQFFPGSGAGHYVKMIHNGIEYGMMQAIAEGFDVLHGKDHFDIDLSDAARIYNNASIIESRLIGWMEDGYKAFGADLEEVSGSAGSGGHQGISASEAKWMVDDAIEHDDVLPVISTSLDERIRTAAHPSYQGRVVNTLRNMFGGHAKK